MIHSSRSRRFLVPGDLSRGMGHRTFFRALALAGDECRGVLWGAEGDLTVPALMEMAREEGVGERVDVSLAFPEGEFLAGVLPYLIPLPDRKFAASILGSGIPLLAVPSGCHREMITDGVNGLYHSPGNHRQLAGQMRHLLENPGLCDYLSRNTGRGR